LASEYFGLTPDLLQVATPAGAVIKAGLDKFSRLTFAGLTANTPHIAIFFANPASHLFQ
jgi:hypothetical protein